MKKDLLKLILPALFIAGAPNAFSAVPPQTLNLGNPFANDDDAPMPAGSPSVGAGRQILPFKHTGEVKFGPHGLPISGKINVRVSEEEFEETQKRFNDYVDKTYSGGSGFYRDSNTGEVVFRAEFRDPFPFPYEGNIRFGYGGRPIGGDVKLALTPDQYADAQKMFQDRRINTESNLKFNEATGLYEGSLGFKPPKPVEPPPYVYNNGTLEAIRNREIFIDEKNGVLRTAGGAQFPIGSLKGKGIQDVIVTSGGREVVVQIRREGENDPVEVMRAGFNSDVEDAKRRTRSMHKFWGTQSKMGRYVDEISASSEEE